MKIIERIFEYIKYKGVTIADFERSNTLSNGYLRKMKQRNADIGETIILNILENSPDISLSWFILGEGSMLKNDDSATKTDVKHSEDIQIPSDDGHFERLLRRIEQLSAENALLKAEIEKMHSGAGDVPSEVSAHAG